MPKFFGTFRVNLFKKHLNEEWSSVNENTHNFKIEHDTAFKHKYRMYIYNVV